MYVLFVSFYVIYCEWINEMPDIAEAIPFLFFTQDEFRSQEVNASVI